MERLNQVNFVILVSLSSSIFAAAEGSPLAAMTVLLAMGTLYFVDFTKSFALPQGMFSILGIGAFAAAGLELGTGDIESRILSGGHLLIYLTWVFLLQPKQHRHFWWLAALSVLQVGVAAVLTTDIWFGFALTLYIFTAMWCLAVFQLHCAVDEAQSSSNQPRLVVGETQHGVMRDGNQKLLTSRFVGSSFGVTALAIFISSLFFLFTPRVWIGGYSLFGDSAVTGQPLTGFTNEVRLGDLGEILENQDPVLSLKLFHAEEDRPFEGKEYLQYLGVDPLFRGASLEAYENGLWVRGRGRRRRPVPLRMDAGPFDVRQEFTVEGIGLDTLFGYGNLVGGTTDQGRPLRTDLFSNEFFRHGDSSDEDPYNYVLAAQSGPPNEAYLRRVQRWPWEFQNYYGAYLESLKQLPPGLERVISMTHKLCENEPTDSERALKILHYLSESGEFDYSLKMDIVDPSVDPVEDFLMNRKAGHCEYFASAMVIMLRGIGVPARVISGFMGGDYDSSRDLFQVRQLHAHTWVEAFLDGRWVSFDPTPASRSESVQELGNVSSFQSLQTSIKGYWTSTVRLSRRQQQDLIYKPIQESLQSSWEVTREAFQGNTTRLRAFLNSLRSPRNWFSARGGIVAFVLLTALSGVFWSMRKLLQLFFGRTHKQKTLRSRGPVVDFYERYCSILEQAGIRRSETVTAREFAQSTRQQLESILDASQLDDFPIEVAEKFYLVRFGHEQLDEAQVQHLNIMLGQLEQNLQDALSKPASTAHESV